MSNKDNSMRDRATWMVRADDPILELLRDLHASSPDEIASQLDYSKEHVNRRLIEMYNRGMLDRPSRGLYRITEQAEKYLNEELDASTIDARDE